MAGSMSDKGTPHELFEKYENTLIIFTSDNGPHKEGGVDPDFFDSNGPLTGIKRNLYEGGIRVPMIASWPGRIKAGSIADHVSAFWDVLPTLAELTHQPIPDEIDGISFLPTLLGQADRQKTHDYLYWEFHEGSSKQAVRMGDWKAVRLAPSEPLELYDLGNDVSESKNVAEKHPDAVEHITTILRDARDNKTTWPLKDEQDAMPF